MTPTLPLPRPEGVHELSEQVPGARLFRVVPADGTARYWWAEIVLADGEQRRRFTSEARARWWLAALGQPRSVPSIYDYEGCNAARPFAEIR